MVFHHTYLHPNIFNSITSFFCHSHFSANSPTLGKPNHLSIYSCGLYNLEDKWPWIHDIQPQIDTQPYLTILVYFSAMFTFSFSSNTTSFFFFNHSSLGKSHSILYWANQEPPLWSFHILPYPTSLNLHVETSFFPFCLRWLSYLYSVQRTLHMCFASQFPSPS